MSNSNSIDNLSLEDKVTLTAMAVAELISASKHNAIVDADNHKYLQGVKEEIIELRKTATRLNNTYLIVQDDLTALAVRLEKLEALQLAELGDGK